METKQLLNKIMDGQDLTVEEAEFLLEEIIQGKLNSAQAGAVLVGLRTKGESVSEIVGFIKTMRKHMVSVPSPLAIDIVGTGGDGVGTFNISTATSFVVAGAGIRVAKHGNRAASSKCGSADVLEALGVNINLSPEQALGVLENIGMVFLFAPLYHPAMKNIAPIRKELGIRTIFNFLGPFLNPAGVRRAVIGVPNIAIAKKLSRVAAELNFDHLFLFASRDGMDELSITEQSVVFLIKQRAVERIDVIPSDFGFKQSGKNNILGGDVTKNAAILKDVLSGKKGPKRDIVLLNSAFALVVSGKVKTVLEGIKLAQDSIDTGVAKNVLDNLIKETRKYGK